MHISTAKSRTNDVSRHCMLFRVSKFKDIVGAVRASRRQHNRLASAR